MSSCYLSYWVIWSRLFFIPPLPWWNNYALKFRIIKKVQSDTFHSDSIEHTLHILLSDDSFSSSGVFTYCWAMETSLVVLLYVSPTGQAVGISWFAALSQDSLFSYIWIKVQASLINNCSRIGIRSHSVGSIIKPNISLQITNKKLKRWKKNRYQPNFLLILFHHGLLVFPLSSQNALASGFRTRHRTISQRSAHILIGKTNLLGLWLLLLYNMDFEKFYFVTFNL